MGSILADIEDTIYDGDQYIIESIIEKWYYNTFLPFIDRINIEADYYYIYKDFDIEDAINKGLQITFDKDIILKWLCDHDKAEVISVEYVLNDDFIKSDVTAPIFCTVPKTKLILTFKNQFYYDIQRIGFMFN